MRRIIRKQLIGIFSFFTNSNLSCAFFYHDIHSDKRYTSMSTSIELFKDHIRLIKKLKYQVVPEINQEKNQLEISFDDGFLGLYDNIDIINKLSIPVQIFVVSSYLGKPNYINEKQLFELSKNPLVTIGSHTHTHTPLPFLEEKEIKEELRLSKEILTNITGKNIDSFCFPLGIFSKKTVDIINNLGYKKQYTSIPGNYMNELLPNVKRRSLVQHASKKEFRNIIRGGDRPLAFWYLKKHYK